MATTSPNTFGVECYSGHTYAQEPRAFVYEGQRRTVAALHRIWREPSGPCFEVLADDCSTYRLMYDEAADQWQAFLSNQCRVLEPDKGHEAEQSRKEIEDDHRSTQGNQRQ